MEIVVGLSLLIIVYFLPTICASQDRTKFPVTVFLTNLLTGWTIIGWIIALAIAVSDEEKRCKENRLKRERQKILTEDLSEKRYEQAKEKGCVIPIYELEKAIDRKNAELRDDLFWEYFALPDDEETYIIEYKEFCQKKSKENTFIDIENRLLERKNKRCGS